MQQRLDRPDDLSDDELLPASPPSMLPTWLRPSRRRRRARRPAGLCARLAHLFSGLAPLVLFAAALASLALYIVSFYVTAVRRGGDAVALVQRDAWAYAFHWRPECKMQRWQKQRYAPIAAANRTVYIAANLYNNEDVLSTFFQELPVLLGYLGEANVFVSVYENGSTDKTVRLLDLFREMLAMIGVAHSIISDPAGKVSHDGDRIATLAGIRNRAMAPLYDGSAARRIPRGAFDEVLFLNDIFHCAADVLEVLHQKRAQGADQACAVDWGDPVVYDRWVLRSMSGHPFYRYDELVTYFNELMPDGTRGPVPPVLPYDPEDRARFLAHKPLQVFSCWNGVTVLDAAPFLAPTDPLRFRVSRADFDEAGRPKNATDKASECFLPSVDLWRQGRGRVLLVPRASVTYGNEEYKVYRKDGLEPPNDAEERVKWVDVPPAKVAMQDYAAWYAPERWAPWDEQ